MLRVSIIVIASIIVICFSIGNIHDSDNFAIVVDIEYGPRYTRNQVVANDTRLLRNSKVTHYLTIGGYSLVTLRSGQYCVLSTEDLKLNYNTPDVQYSMDRYDEVVEEEFKSSTANCPERVLQAINGKGWLFKITLENLTELYRNDSYNKENPESRVTGATVFSDKTIKLLQTEDVLQYTVNHELGHYIDHALAYGDNYYLSDTKEFQEIYEEEVSSFKPLFASKSYVTSEPKEFFAEAINQCIMFPDAISKQCPKTYIFCMACIAEIK